MEDDDEERACLSRSLGLLEEHSAEVTCDASNQIDAEGGQEEAEEILKLVVCTQSEVEDQGHQERREDLEQDVRGHTSEQVGSGGVHFVHEFSFEDGDLKGHLDDDESDGREHEGIDEQEGESLDVLDGVLDIGDQIGRGAGVGHVEEEQQDENCHNHNVQEQGLEGTRVTHQVGHVTLEDFSELEACRDFSLSGYFSEFGFNSIVELDNGLHLLDNSRLQYVIKVLFQLIHSQSRSYHVGGLHSLDDEVSWVHKSTHLNAH
jgi:hypothetical protein